MRKLVKKIMKPKTAEFDEIKKRVAQLSDRQLAARVAEIVTIPERPKVGYTSHGIRYVRPFDIFTSRSGREIISRYSKASPAVPTNKPISKKA